MRAAHAYLRGLAAVSALLVAGLNGCGGTGAGHTAARLGATVASSAASTPTVPYTTPTSTSPTSTTPTRTRPGTTTAAAPAPAAHPATTAPAATPPAFVGTVSALGPGDVAASYRPGCPVGPSELRMLHLSFWGFDGQAHLGAMVVNQAVASAVVAVFARLYGARFPIRRMAPVDAYAGSDAASMAADNTSAFNCRYAAAPGPPQWSVHAYGEAIDVDPVENPYLEGGAVQPPAGAAYLDRATARPGMAVPGGPLVVAFSAAGWAWGGRWASAPDYQHFSLTGG